LRFGEARVVHRRVEFDFVNRDGLLLVLPSGMRFDFEREFQAIHIAIVEK